MATAEFSKFAGTLSAALSQHHQCKFVYVPKSSERGRKTHREIWIYLHFCHLIYLPFLSLFYFFLSFWKNFGHGVWLVGSQFPNQGLGLPWWLSGKESACQFRRCEFDLSVGRIPWRRKWQSIPVFFPGKFHVQRSLAGYSSWGQKESNMIQQWKQQ